MCLQCIAVQFCGWQSILKSKLAGSYWWAHFFLMLCAFWFFIYEIIFSHFQLVANDSFYDWSCSTSPEGLPQLCSLTLRNCKPTCKISQALCDQLWFSCKMLESRTMRLAALKSNHWNFTSKHQLWLLAAREGNLNCAGEWPAHNWILGDEWL